IAIDLIISLQRGCLSRSGQSPELAATFEYPSCFQLIAGDLSQIPVELQHLTRLHNLVAVGNHRQRRFGVGAVQHLLFRERVNTSYVANSVCFEVNRALLDLPVHTGLTLPDFNGLFLRQLTAEAMPRGRTNVSHLFDLMSHD